MTSKLSAQQAELLILIADNSEIDKDGMYWIPPSGYKQSYSPTLGRSLYIDGAGVASTLKSLARRGLIAFIDKGKYFSRITEDGRLQVEAWRETNTWPVKVAYDSRQP